MATQTKTVLAPGARIRVLVVDDSVVIRRLVSLALGEEPLIEVVGTAPNGAIALAKIPQVNPDVLTLDIEMPELDGLATLKRLRAEFPHVRVIMFSTLTRKGASATIEALLQGADDYVAKASNAGQLGESLAALRGELVPKIRQFFAIAEAAAPPRPAPRPAVVGASPVRFQPHLTRKVVAIGVSTGGPTALAEIMPTFPAGFSLPIVIVQHMPPMFTRLLAERLQKQSALDVVEAAEGTPIVPGRVLIAPGDHHLRVRRNGEQVVAALDRGPHENSCRPAVDVLFRSVNERWGGATIAVILTGMGQDGLRGIEQLKASGAYVIAQDEATSVVWGMPGAVARANLADAVVPLDRVVPEILRQL